MSSARSKETVWRGVSQSSRRHRLTRPVRIAILLAVGLGLIGLAFFFRNYNVSKPVELQAVAEPGVTRIRLSGLERRPMSPGCGCLDPAFGAHEWFGFSLPSTSFDMRLASKPSPSLDSDQWALTAMSPELAPIDWLESPNHTLYMRVTADGHDHRRVLFAGRTTYALTLVHKKIHINYGRRYPYAALLPAANGLVELDAEPNSRPEFGSAMSVNADAPSRSKLPAASQIKSEKEYREHTDLTQRGPMIDILGPVVHLAFSAPRDLDLFAGAKHITGIQPGERVRIALRTPYAIRLFPQPVTRKWRPELDMAWKRVLVAAKEGDKDAIEHTKFGPTLVGRAIDGSPVPESQLQLTNFFVPPPARWRKFAQISAHHGEVKQMLTNNRSDYPFTTTYELPPVERQVEVGVFGPLASLESSSLRGRVLTDGKVTSFGRGQDVSVENLFQKEV